ncbi:transposase [Isosphaeraceae bacterium EP7]
MPVTPGPWSGPISWPARSSASRVPAGAAARISVGPTPSPSAISCLRSPRSALTSPNTAFIGWAARGAGPSPGGVVRQCAARVFGPRLQATIALLGGAYRLSKRRIVAMLKDLLGLSISPGMVCKAERACSEALATPVGAVYIHVKDSPAAGVDETGWKLGGKRAWLWMAVTAGATAFRVTATRGAKELFALVGEPIGPVITCDRYSTYAKAPDRQTCWVHTIRTQSTNRPGAWLLLGSASLPIARPRGLLRAGA